MRNARASLLVTCVVVPLLGAASCGGQPAPTAPAASAATLDCPAPIGRVPRESCGDIADDFGALTVSGALKLAGTGHDAELRIRAIRAAGGLANALKERRVKLCEDYDACKVAPKDHASEDARLAGMMSALIKLWDGRSFADPEHVARFEEQVAALRASLDGGGDEAGAPAAAATAAAPATRTTRLAPSVLARVEDPAVTFQEASGAITAAVRDAASHEVLASRADQLVLAAGKRYQIKVTGSFEPATRSLADAGDLVVRLAYRADAAGEVYVALRSLEDPDLPDASAIFKVAAGEKNKREVTLTAPPGTSGVYLAIGAHGTAVDLDDVEVARAGQTIASAHAETKTEPGVASRCTTSSKHPIGGKGSFHCEPAVDHDLVTIGEPSSYVFLAVRGPSGERARLRTTSLEGGRTIDAAVTEPSQLVIGVAGGGTATIRGLEVTQVD